VRIGENDVVGRAEGTGLMKRVSLRVVATILDTEAGPGVVSDWWLRMIHGNFVGSRIRAAK
jgi:hypothetical protein